MGHGISTIILSQRRGSRWWLGIGKNKRLIANVSELSEVPLAVAESSGDCFPLSEPEAKPGYLSDRPLTATSVTSTTYSSTMYSSIILVVIELRSGPHFLRPMNPVTSKLVSD